MLCCMEVLDGISGGCVPVNGSFFINQRLSWCLLLLSKEVQAGVSSAEEDFVILTYWILQYLMHFLNVTRQNSKGCPSYSSHFEIAVNITCVNFPLPTIKINELVNLEASVLKEAAVSYVSIV